MNRRATLADLPADYREQASAQIGAVPRAAKYRNTKCELAGQQFDSRLERDVYRELSSEVLWGRIRAVIRQVSMPLPQSRRRIRIDFLVVYLDGSLRWIDAKGHMTPAWASKRDQVRTAYGIDIELRRKAARGSHAC